MAEGKTGRLIVHTGDHKTGSTSIQNALATGRVTLPGRTLCYPSRMAHNYLGPEIAKASNLDNTSLGALMERIARAGADVTIISAEAFEGQAPRRMRKVRDRFLARVSDDVVFVSYVRPHLPRLVSSYAENIKIGFFAGDLDGFFDRMMRHKRLHYAPRLRAWRKTFGAEYLLRPMIRSELKGGDVVQDFFHTALAGQPFEVAPGGAANESLGLRDLMLLKLVHGYLEHHPVKKRHELGWTIARFLSDQADPPPEQAQDKLRLHRPLAERIAAAYRADAEAVDTEMFGGRPLFRTELDKAVEAAPQEAQSLAPEDYFSLAERRSIEALTKSIDLLLGMKGKVAAHLLEERIRALHGA